MSRGDTTPLVRCPPTPSAVLTGRVNRSMPVQSARRETGSDAWPGHFPEGVLRSVPLDRTSIPQDVLDIREKERSNPLEWKGQFSPQLVEALLGFYEGRNERVLDPFVGSGTVILEAARMGLHPTGVEVNPAAYHLAAFYSLLRVPPAQRSQILGHAESLLGRVSSTDGPLFAAEQVTPQERASLLNEAWSRAKAQRGGNQRGYERYLAALLVLADIANGELREDKLLRVQAHLSDLLRELPFCPRCDLRVLLGDARNTGVADRSIDVVLTSPPYVNVYNYHQKYRGSVEKMGWDVLAAARSEIGSNRKHRGNRILTVIQYCMDMADVFAEIRRVLKRRGTAVLVVGRESMVRKTRFYNGEMLAEIAARACGLELRQRQERVFLNRFGQHIFEDIIHLSVAPGSRAIARSTRHARSRLIAGHVLEDALSSCPDETRQDIRSALDELDQVKPSPLSDMDLDAS